MTIPFKRIGYIRHFIACTEEILEELYLNRIIAIHYDNIPSINSSDYTESKGAETSFKRLEEFCKDGALIAADYHLIHPEKLVIGIIRAGSKIKPMKKTYPAKSKIRSEETSYSERISEKGGFFWYKTLQLEETKEIDFWDFPVLKSILPPYQAVCNWNNAEEILPSIFKYGKLKWDVYSLATEQLEILCYEYLKEKRIIDALLLPIGRSLPEVDIIGFNLKNETIFAQVTFETKDKKILSKIKKLKWCKETELKQKIKLYFFLPDSLIVDYELNNDIEFIGIEDIFRQFSKKEEDPIHFEMLRRWLNPKNL